MKKTSRPPKKFLNLKRINKFVSWYKKQPTYLKSIAILILFLMPVSLITILNQPSPYSGLTIQQLEESPNYALEFQHGSYNYVQAINTSTVDEESPGFTIELWMRPENFIHDESTLVRLSDESETKTLKINVNNPGEIVVSLPKMDENNTTLTLHPTQDLARNTWHHLALVYSESLQTIKLFIDGQEKAHAPIDLTAGYLQLLPRLLLATDYTGSNYVNDYHGAIEDVRISSTPRYVATFTPAPFNSFEVDDETQVYWKFNEDGVDSSGNDIDAELINNPTFFEVTDEPTHSICIDYQCESVVGFGTSTCEEDIDCEPDPTPTPTPAPTATPTPSPAPTPSCQKEAPHDKPDLYQINTTNSQATLFFVPATPPYTQYVVEYGEQDYFEHSTSFSVSNATGALSATIKSLKPNTTYGFKVRALNGCQPGTWSNTLKAKTTTSSQNTASYYKNFAARINSTVNTNSNSTKPTVKPTTLPTLRPTASPTTRPTTSPTSSLQPQAKAVATKIEEEQKPENETLWQKIVNFFRRLFGLK